MHLSSDAITHRFLTERHLGGARKSHKIQFWSRRRKPQWRRGRGKKWGGNHSRVRRGGDTCQSDTHTHTHQSEIISLMTVISWIRLYDIVTCSTALHLFTAVYLNLWVFCLLAALIECCQLFSQLFLFFKGGDLLVFSVAHVTCSDLSPAVLFQLCSSRYLN